ncbi:MAG TPA: protein translocase subunit SecF, partial [Hellea balneolensis]|nr:protein translocase subunit SecF [Hellea balneolensis]
TDQIEDIRKIGNTLGLGDVALQTITQANGHEALRLSIPKQAAKEGADNDDTAQQEALEIVRSAIAEKYPSAAKTDNTLSVQVLGTKVSGELKRKGIMAVVAALSLVLIYIWIRFEWQFGLGAVAALAHDVILTIGVFSLTGREFNLAIVAAILTIVGYSLNDTVIVYDRIRENLRKFKKMDLREVLNLSINDTLSRTVMTSFTTLLALFALYFKGGPGLNGFAFAMIWGIFVGTYSSIFVASPILMLLGVNRGGKQK